VGLRIMMRRPIDIVTDELTKLFPEEE